MDLQTLLALSAATASALYLLRDLAPYRKPRPAACGGCGTQPCTPPKHPNTPRPA